VCLFAGAFTFGTLLSLPGDGGAYRPDQVSAIANLLSVAFVCFSTGLFLTVALQLVLRREGIDRVLYGRKRLLVAIHFALIGILAVTGFIILNGILITIGQLAAGIAGIVLLVMCAAWITGSSKGFLGVFQPGKT